METKEQAVKQIREFIEQDCELDPANYGAHADQIAYSSARQIREALDAYETDKLEMSRQKGRARMGLLLFETMPYDRAVLERIASGRLLIENGKIVYHAGQYYDLEYNAAMASVLERYYDEMRPKKLPDTPIFNTVEEIKRASYDAGYHFFDEDTMRYFKSRVLDDIFGGNVFITSEKKSDDPRHYTIRQMQKDASIETIGEYDQFNTAAVAKKYAQRFADGETFITVSMGSVNAKPYISGIKVFSHGQHKYHWFNEDRREHSQKLLDRLLRQYGHIVPFERRYGPTVYVCKKGQ